MNFWWTGTDSLMLIDFSRRTFKEKISLWIFRGFVKYGERFIGVHYINSATVEKNLKQFGVRKPIVYKMSPVKYDKKLPKKGHDGFNVLYYMPIAGNIKFNHWLYGGDVFNRVVDVFKDEVNFIIVDGSQDMEEVYPITDFFIRCNNHDGNSRMVRECIIQEIPYYWSQTDPNYHEIIKNISALLQ